MGRCSAGRGQHRAVRGGVHADEADECGEHVGGRVGGGHPSAHGLGGGEVSASSSSRLPADDASCVRCAFWCERGVALAVHAQARLRQHSNPLALGPIVGTRARLVRPWSLITLLIEVAEVLLPWVSLGAGRGELDAGAWVLAAGLYFWQLPHFLALAYMFKADYAAGGHRMLSLVRRRPLSLFFTSPTHCLSTSLTLLSAGT